MYRIEISNSLQKQRQRLVIPCPRNIEGRPSICITEKDRHTSISMTKQTANNVILLVHHGHH